MILGIEDESRMGGFRFCIGFVRHTTGPDRSSLGLPVKPAMTEYASRRNTRYRNDRYDTPLLQRRQALDGVFVA